MPFKDLPEGQTQYLDENGNTVGDINMKWEECTLTKKMPYWIDVEDVKEFYYMKDRERNNIVSWLNKITGLNYNLRRSDEERNTSPMILFLGEDEIIMHQEWGYD